MRVIGNTDVEDRGAALDEAVLEENMLDESILYVPVEYPPYERLIAELESHGVFVLYAKDVVESKIGNWVAVAFHTPV